MTLKPEDDDDNIEVIGGDLALGGDLEQDPDQGDEGKSLTDLVEQPAKVMRIGTMIKQLLEEVRSAPLDEAQVVAALDEAGDYQLA